MYQATTFLDSCGCHHHVLSWQYISLLTISSVQSLCWSPSWSCICSLIYQKCTK